VPGKNESWIERVAVYIENPPLCIGQNLNSAYKNAGYADKSRPTSMTKYEKNISTYIVREGESTYEFGL